MRMQILRRTKRGKGAVAGGKSPDKAQVILCGLLLFVASTLTALALAPQQQPSNAKPPADQQQISKEFPDGPGKDTFLRTCSRCHSPTNVLANGQDEQGWENTITKMVSLGATGSDEDFTDILDYLVKNFPAPSPVNVNKATADQLETGLKLAQKDAEAVVAYRQKNGDFKTLDDLKKVPGIDPAKLDAKKNMIVFQ
jgi:competence protein ComEA